MNTKHRAYALTEMMVIIASLVVLIALSARPLRVMISEIPRLARVCQTLNTTQTALIQLKKDIEQSAQIVTLQNGALILKHDKDQITYLFSDGTITRRPGLNQQDAEYTWQLPHVRIEADLWSQNNKPCAVELTMWNQQTVLGQEQKKFKQAMVFFQKEKRQ